MDLVSEEFVFVRMGEPLEKRLRDNESFQQRMKALYRVSKIFVNKSNMSGECQKLYDMLEDEWTKYSAQYGEEAYHLGFEDGVQIATEKKIRAKGSVLSFQDMTHLIYVYDAIRKLNKSLIGEWEIHNRDGGVLEELNRVYDVIEDGVCAEIRLRGEDEAFECVTDILDAAGKAPEERAKLLVGIE